ncbi:MAG: CDP-glycerol glycerophosphotransferase family protein [Acidiferrobacterales bacterium]
MRLIRNWASHRRFRRLNADQRNIVFYSESKQDWHHLSPIINYLTSALSRTVCYVTSDVDDYGLSQDNARLLPFCIEEGTMRTWFFQMLEADVMVLTMLDLNNLELKRSIHSVYYIYMFHGMGSTHMVDFENSYDHYDAIFCVGPHQLCEIRRREELNKLKAKHLFEHGYHRLEELMAERLRRTPATNPDDPVTVLLAPTWGDQSILNSCGDELIAVLLSAGYRVIMRPHYHTRRLTPHVVDHLVNRFQGEPLFEYMELMGETDSLFGSDLLICDWSAMAVEYALALEKPVLFIDVPRRIRNPNYRKLGIAPIEEFIRDDVGTVLNPDRLAEAPRHIEALLKAPDQFREKIEALRGKLVFNLGHSAEAAAKEIARIADEKAHERRERSS